MWQSITIDEPMKPIAPMPMLLPSSLNSSSSAAIFGSGIARADDAQAGRLLAQHHAGVLGAAEPDADDRRLAGEPALAEADQRVEIEPLDAVDAVAGKQHAVIGAEQAALVHGGELDPVGVGMERVLDLGRADADIVVVVGAPERMHAVGTQRHVVAWRCAVARRSAASSATGPPSMRASLPILTYQRGRPVSPHMARRSSLAAS